MSPDDCKFECDRCELKFVTKELLETHKRIHDKGSRLSCQLCYKNFKKNVYLQNHLKVSHVKEVEFLEREILPSDLRFKCNNCTKSFVSSGLLATHNNQHQADVLKEKYSFLRLESFNKTANAYRCKLCYTEFRYFRELASHLNGIHLKDQDLLHQELENGSLCHRCQKCGLKFATAILLDYHDTKSHLLEIPQYCKLCDVSFKSPGRFLIHKYNIHREEISAFHLPLANTDSWFQCLKCSQKYMTQASVDYHITRDHRVRKKKCNTKFKVKSENLERYCQLCYITYKEPQFLRIHKKKVHANEMDAFDKELYTDDMNEACGKCDKSFYSKNTLKYHMQRKHQMYEREVASCRLCYRTFSCKGNLESHKNTVHTSKEEIEAFDVKLGGSSLPFQWLLNFPLTQKETNVRNNLLFV